MADRTTIWGFAGLALDDVILAAMDGGTHGVAGHTAVVLADGTVRWDRRFDTMGPDRLAGSGRFALEAGEAGDVARWTEAAFRLADPARPWPPREPYDPGRPPAPPPPPPAWAWRVIVRRGTETRVLEGNSHVGSPDELGPLLDWLRSRVDAAAKAAAGMP